MVSIKKQKEEYVAGLAGVNSCPCFVSVKDGILTLDFQQSYSKTTTIQLLAKDIELQFDNQSTINTAAVGGGALVGGLVFGGVGALLGGLGASNTKNNGLIIKLPYNGQDSVIYFKPSPTTANLFNQLLLFKSENKIVDIQAYNEDVKESKAKAFILIRWLFGFAFIVMGVTQSIETPQMLSLSVAGIVLLPPTFPFLQKKTNVKLHTYVKKAIFGLLMAIAVFPPPTPTPSVPTPKDTLQILPDSITPYATKEQIENQFSSWDGSHYYLVKAVKKAMHDPESFEHNQTSYVQNGNVLVVRMSYRGKNSLGAKVLSSVVAQVDAQSGDILSLNTIEE